MVERSADRRAFQALGEVAAAGESVVPQAYAFVDDQPLAGLNYYRLRMVDLDGSFVYSPTIAISTGLEALQVQGAYPNPAEQTLNLLVSVPAAGEANLELIAPTGQVVRRQALSLDAGTQALPIHVGDLASGMYFYRLRHQGRAQSGKWVKQ
ncbi:MAG: T9SS C-terminal target domain-containing protein [Bacteroidetes bacterium]|nr:MAG: T9SS C-terminal target domain-containing protein [Bacteroidota bacterium]